MNYIPRYVAIASDGSRSPVSARRAEVDGWAADAINRGIDQVLVYVQNRYRKTCGELVGKWRGRDQP